MHYIGNAPATPAAALTVGTGNISDGAATLAKLDRTGTAGQVLTANGAGVAPSWQTPSTPAATASVPPGAMMAFAGATAPAGWLLCDGSAVSRTTYAALFAVVNTVYGMGDSLTTFNLPDMRGRVAAGLDNMGGTAASRLTAAGSGVSGSTLGAAGGAQTHTLTIAQMPAHTHNYDRTPQSGGYISSDTFNPRGSHTSAATSSTGGNAAHNNVQPTLVANYIIKT